MLTDYSSLRYSAAISSTLVSRGLPGRQASAKADSARKCDVLFLRDALADPAGMPTSAESCFDRVAGGLAVLVLGHARRTPSTPMARAISRYFSPVHGGVVLHDGGQQNGVGDAVGGVVAPRPGLWAIEWTMPRPTLEKPMPAMYWPRAMPFAALGVFSPRRGASGR